MSALALSAAPALAADDGDGTKRQREVGAASPGLSRDLAAAVQRDLGLSATQARQQGALQAKAIKLDRQLQDSLGEAFAGSVYDQRSGKLVVMVSDADQLDEATAAGAKAQLVKHSKARLDAIKHQLDVAAGQKGSDPADRAPAGEGEPLAAGVTSWYVDAATNAVKVTVQEGEAQAAKDALAKYGDAVEIAESDLAPSTVANFIDGGDYLGVPGGSCSVGFNLRNPSTGARYMLTAGHCVKPGNAVFGQGPVFFGTVLESWFPGFDDALIRADNPAYWIQGPWVDTNPSNGGIINIGGQPYTDAPVGTTVCKSGITTRWTCGQITVKRETVVYDGVYTVNNLTRHSACVEKGDSGGSNLSVTNAYRPEGVTSGASMLWDNVAKRYRCRGAYGLQNISWYYPLALSMPHYGPKYGIPNHLW